MSKYNKYKILKKEDEEICQDVMSPPQTRNKSRYNEFKRQNLEYDKHTMNFIKT
jgi:hypothetical protein